jgi:hypothetical protein
MLRKITNIFFASLLLVITAGFTITRHYCSDNLVSMNINSEAESCCDNQSCSRCHTDIEHFQFKEDWVLPLNQRILDIANDTSPFLTVDCFINNLIPEKSYVKIAVYFNSLSPPRIQTVLARLQTLLI